MSIQVVWNYGDYSCKWTLLPYWICNSEGIAQSLPTDTQCWNSRSNFEKSYQDKSPPEVKGEGRGCRGELHQNGEATACGGRLSLVSPPTSRRSLLGSRQRSERLPVATSLLSGSKSLQSAEAALPDSGRWSKVKVIDRPGSLIIWTLDNWALNEPYLIYQPTCSLTRIQPISTRPTAHSKFPPQPPCGRAELQTTQVPTVLEYKQF